MSDTNNNNPGMPTPDPDLQRLDPLVGTWNAHGRFIGATEDNIVGTKVA